MSDKKKSIGALWKQKSAKGVKYYSGEVNGKRIIAFINSNKQKPTQPDIQIYPSDDIKKKDQPVDIYGS